MRVLAWRLWLLEFVVTKAEVELGLLNANK